LALSFLDMKLPYSLRVAITYFLLGCLWILFSDQAVLKLVDDSRTLILLQMYKGWFFVGISSLIIYLLVRRFERTLSRTILRLRQTNDDLRLFLYKTSHNLRGPVASSLGLVRIAKESTQEPETRAYIEKLEMLSEKTDLILKDLINLAKIIEGDLHYQEVEVHALVEECVKEARELHKEAEIDIHNEVEPSLHFTCDPDLLRMIVLNLVENAIKYRRVGEEPSWLKISPVTTRKTISLRFEDNGRGIEKEVQNKIFSMFFRASHTSTGVGMGLYIVNTAVHRLKGLVGVHTELGKGSTFSVVLPLRGV
jgi:signal transduction histidine kinase